MDGFVRTAQFSRDRKHILMALGSSEEQIHNLDFIIYSLQTKEIKRLPKVLKGYLTVDELYGNYIPIHFKDDGAFVYFRMKKKEDFMDEEYVYYRYHWERGELEEWQPPVPYFQINASYKGAYKLYAEKGLYHDSQFVTGNLPYRGKWLGNTLNYAYLKTVKKQHETFKQMQIYNADTGKIRVLIGRLPVSAYLLGSSADGTRIYLAAPKH